MIYKKVIQWAIAWVCCGAVLCGAVFFLSERALGWAYVVYGVSAVFYFGGFYLLFKALRKLDCEQLNIN